MSAMTHSIFTLDPNYSTTRLVSTIKPQIEDHPEAKFKTHLFLPEGEGRQDEGGLRSKGYFKHSYARGQTLYVKSKTVSEEDKMSTGNIDTKTNTNTITWYITDSDNNPIQPAPPEIQQKINDYFTSNTSHLTPDTSSSTDNSKLKIQNSKLDQLPLISIITVVFNGEKYLEETIQSVINQTYYNVEYIIIDGGSTDGTLDIIKKYEHAIDYWLSEPDKGISDAFNKGIACAIGDIIGIINADDYYENNASENIFINYKSGDIFFGNFIHFNKFRKYIKKSEKEAYKDLLKCKMGKIYHSTVFVKKKVYKDTGLFNNNIKCAMDYDFLLRAILSNYNFYFINRQFAYMRLGGISQRFLYKAKYEVLKSYKVQLNVIIDKNMIIQFFYVCRSYIKFVLLKYRLKKIVNIYRKLQRT